MTSSTAFAGFINFLWALFLLWLPSHTSPNGFSDWLIYLLALGTVSMNVFVLSGAIQPASGALRWPKHLADRKAMEEELRAHQLRDEISKRSAGGGH